MMEILVIYDKMTKKKKKCQGTYSKMFSIQNPSRRETIIGPPLSSRHREF